MTETVLIPIDGSPLSFAALRHAFDTFPDASITVIHVIDLYEPGYTESSNAQASYEPLLGSDEWYKQTEERTAQLLDECRELANDLNMEIATTSDIGDPKRIIVDYAADEPVDHIVMGAHGRSEKDRQLFGSVTEVVARRAPIPVTIIR